MSSPQAVESPSAMHDICVAEANSQIYHHIAELVNHHVRGHEIGVRQPVHVPHCSIPRCGAACRHRPWRRKPRTTQGPSASAGPLSVRSVVSSHVSHAQGRQRTVKWALDLFSGTGGVGAQLKKKRFSGHFSGYRPKRKSHHSL